MTDDQRVQWRQALARQAAADRRRRYQPRRAKLTRALGAGRIRVLPPSARER